jgi:transcription antitermination factor NusG
MEGSMAVQWYAINSHPNKEEVLWKHIESMGYEVFFPRLKVNPVNPRSRKLRPYFPGYMFIKTDLDVIGMSTFQWMPHAKGLVAFGGEAAIVPEALIHAIRQRVLEIAAAGGEKLDGLVPGDTVVIDSGPFEGYEAILDERLPGTERVRVLLKMLSNRHVPLEIGVGSIRKKRRPSRPYKK